MIEVASYKVFEIYLGLLTGHRVALCVGINSGQCAFAAFDVVEREYVAELAVVIGISPAAQ